MSAFQDATFVEDEVPICDEVAKRAGVRSITGRTVSISAGVQSPSSFRSYDLEYGMDGARSRQESHAPGGSLLRRWLYEPQGRLVRTVTHDPSGDVVYQVDIRTEDQGWVEKRLYSRSGDLTHRIVAGRDASGRLLQARYLDPDEAPIRVDSYHYDARGLLLRVASENLGDCLYEYDSRQNLRLRTRNFPGMSVHGDVAEFSYDPRDLLIRMEHAHISVTVFEFVFASEPSYIAMGQ